MEISNCNWKTSIITHVSFIKQFVIQTFLHAQKTQSKTKGTCLYVLGVEVQGVADFRDVYWSVVSHSFLFL